MCFIVKLKKIYEPSKISVVKFLRLDNSECKLNQMFGRPRCIGLVCLCDLSLKKVINLDSIALNQSVSNMQERDSKIRFASIRFKRIEKNDCKSNYDMWSMTIHRTVCDRRENIKMWKGQLEKKTKTKLGFRFVFENILETNVLKM